VAFVDLLSTSSVRFCSFSKGYIDAVNMVVIVAVDMSACSSGCGGQISKKRKDDQPPYY
jgi:hypothetical protein